MGEFEITIKCVIPGNVEGWTFEEWTRECLSRTFARGEWKGNICKTQWGELEIVRVK